MFEKLKYTVTEDCISDEVRKFLNTSKTFSEDTFVRLADIQSELGELSKEILKATRYGKTETPTRHISIEDEYGDLLFSVLALGVELKTQPEYCVRKSLEKYEKRLAKTGQIGSGV